MRQVILILISAIVFSGCVKSGNQIIRNDETPAAPIIRVSASDVDAAEPAVASNNENVFVVWVEHGKDKTGDVFLRNFDLNGKPAGEKIRVNPTAGQAKAWRGDAPTIAVKDQKIYVGWTARSESADESADDLYLSMSSDGGKSFAAPVKVNDDKIPCVHGMHSLAINGDGKVFMAWLDERYLKNQPAETRSRNDFHYEKTQDQTKSETKPMEHGEANRETYFAVSTDDGKTFAPNRKLAGNVCPCCKTATLAAPGGRIYVAWRQVVGDNFRHIAVAASSDGGSAFSAPVIVSDDRWQIAGCPVSGASLAAGANDALEVLWFSAGTNDATGLYQSESINGGASFSPRRLIGESVVTGTPVLLDSAAIWSADGKLLMKKSEANAQTIGDGELPAATMAGGKIFTAFVAKENEKRAVWLSGFN